MNSRDVQQLVVAFVARTLEISDVEVPLDVALDEQGLDSLALIKLAGALAEHLAVPVDPTLCYEYPDIPTLCAQLARMSEGAAASATPPVPAGPRRERWVTAPFVTPRTPWQRRLATACADALNVDRVGLYDPFDELLLTAEPWASAWRNALGALGIPSSAPTTAQHVAALAADVEAGADGDHSTTSPSTLEDEAELPADIAPRAGAPIPDRIETVLLTGGTGYVGAYLLDQLLRQSTSRVLCLVRAGTVSDGLQRIRRNLERYGLSSTDVDERVEVVVADLAAPGLGVDPATWESLQDRVDVIVHNGAWVNFVLPYQPLKPANVDGTIEILRLATGRRTIPLHFISTLWILATDDEGLTRTVLEDDPTGNSENLPNGYEQSKWVADRLVQEAMRRGLPVSIHRLGLMSGESVGGQYHQAGDFLSAFVKGCLQMGSMPSLEQELEMVPVDFTAQVVIGRVLDPSSSGLCYHLTHPDAAIATDAIPVLRSLGFPLVALDWEDWKAQFLGLGPRLADNALAPFVEFIRPVAPHQTGLPPLDLTNFRSAVAASAAHCPPSLHLLEQYVRYFQDVGFLRRPTPAAAP